MSQASISHFFLSVSASVILFTVILHFFLVPVQSIILCIVMLIPIHPNLWGFILDSFWITFLAYSDWRVNQTDRYCFSLLFLSEESMHNVHLLKKCSSSFSCYIIRFRILGNFAVQEIILFLFLLYYKV